MCPHHDCPPSLLFCLSLQFHSWLLPYLQIKTILFRIDSQTTAMQLFVTVLLAPVSAIIFVYCDGPENKWRLRVDFHPPLQRRLMFAPDKVMQRDFDG